jgi:hypothetical protein
MYIGKSERLQSSDGSINGGLRGGIMKSRVVSDNEHTFQAPTEKPKGISLLGLDKLAQRKREDLKGNKKELMSFSEDNENNSYPSTDVSLPPSLQDKKGDKDEMMKRHYRRKEEPDTPSHPGGVNESRREHINERTRGRDVHEDNRRDIKRDGKDRNDRDIESSSHRKRSRSRSNERGRGMDTDRDRGSESNRRRGDSSSDRGSDRSSSRRSNRGSDRGSDRDRSNDRDDSRNSQRRRDGERSERRDSKGSDSQYRDGDRHHDRRSDNNSSSSSSREGSRQRDAGYLGDRGSSSRREERETPFSRTPLIRGAPSQTPVRGGMDESDWEEPERLNTSRTARGVTTGTPLIRGTPMTDRSGTTTVGNASMTPLSVRGKETSEWDHPTPLRGSGSTGLSGHSDSQTTTSQTATSSKVEEEIEVHL